MTLTTTARFIKFREWVEDNGGSLHPTLNFVQDSRGSSVHTGENISIGTAILRCPFSLAITATTAYDALETLLGSQHASALKRLSESELICTYVTLHWVRDLHTENLVLKHRPYFDTVPPMDSLRTPLYFTREELSLLAGTNLYHASIDRKTEWEEKWQKCQHVLSQANNSWATEFTWQRYSAAATYLSSRAFPSSLLSRDPTVAASENSHPVLLPAVDCLNHARGAKVTWEVSEIPSSAEHLQISLVIEGPIAKGEQVFNNYGMKSNGELILGYGFAIPNNPEDTLVLKLGGTGTHGKRNEVGRDAAGFETVYLEFKKAFLQQIAGEEDAPEDWEIEMEVVDRLKEMVEVLRLKIQAASDKLEGVVARGDGVRQEVLTMIMYYVQGQQDIVDGLAKHIEGRWEAAAMVCKDHEPEYDEYEEEEEEE